jgi:hypothetical protein
MRVAGMIAAAARYAEKTNIRSVDDACQSLPSIRWFCSASDVALLNATDHPFECFTNFSTKSSCDFDVSPSGKRIPGFSAALGWVKEYGGNEWKNKFRQDVLCEPAGGCNAFVSSVIAALVDLLPHHDFPDARAGSSDLGSVIEAVCDAAGGVLSMSPDWLYSFIGKWQRMFDPGNLEGFRAFLRIAQRDIFGCEMKLDSYKREIWHGWNPDGKHFRRDIWEWTPLFASDVLTAWSESLLAGGARLYHEDFCIISERPEAIHVDAEGLLHCENGSALRWRDGTFSFHQHGVDLPARMASAIINRESITVASIEQEKNTELRRFLIGRFGAEKYIQQSDAKVCQTFPDDHPIVGLRTARLLRKQVNHGYQGKEWLVFLDKRSDTAEPDGSYKRIWQRIDPDAYGGKARHNLQAAAASTVRDADGWLVYEDWRDYKPM